MEASSAKSIISPKSTTDASFVIIETNTPLQFSYSDSTITYNNAFSYTLPDPEIVIIDAIWPKEKSYFLLTGQAEFLLKYTKDSSDPPLAFPSAGKAGINGLVLKEDNRDGASKVFIGDQNGNVYTVDYTIESVEVDQSLSGKSGVFSSTKKIFGITQASLTQRFALIAGDESLPSLRDLDDMGSSFGTVSTTSCVVKAKGQMTPLNGTNLIFLLCLSKLDISVPPVSFSLNILNLNLIEAGLIKKTDITSEFTFEAEEIPTNIIYIPGAKLLSISGLKPSTHFFLKTYSFEASCHSSCFTCSSTGETKCTSCSEGQEVENGNFEGKCVNLPSGESIKKCGDKLIRQCSACSESNINRCGECLEGYGLSQSGGEGLLCGKCLDLNCLKCDKVQNGTLCLKCKNGLVYDEERRVCSKEEDVVVFGSDGGGGGIGNGAYGVDVIFFMCFFGFFKVIS